MDQEEKLYDEVEAVKKLQIYVTFMCFEKGIRFCS